MVFDAFRRGPVLSGKSVAPAQYLPKVRRQYGYAALMALAANHGIRVGINAVTNPDFRLRPAAPGNSHPDNACSAGSLPFEQERA
jgi:hypothetical protein